MSSIQQAFDFGLDVSERLADVDALVFATPAPSSASGTSTPSQTQEISPSSAGLPARQPSGDVSEVDTASGTGAQSPVPAAETEEGEDIALETPEAVTNATSFELPEELAADPEAVRARNVYVAGLPLDFGAAHFTQLLEQFGKIVTCRFIDDNRRAQRAQRAYGFVLYDTAEAAAAAVEALHGLTIGEEELIVRLSENGVVKPPPAPKKRKSKDDEADEAADTVVVAAPPKPKATPKSNPSKSNNKSKRNNAVRSTGRRGHHHAHPSSSTGPQVVFMPVPMMPGSVLPAQGAGAAWGTQMPPPPPFGMLPTMQQQHYAPSMLY